MTLRIVHVVSQPFLPADDGGRLKTACIAAALASRGELHWVSLDGENRDPGERIPPHPLELPWGGSGIWHATSHVNGWRKLPRSPSGWLRAARCGVRLPLGWLPRTARHGEVMAEVARLQPDLVVADATHLAPFAAFAPARWRIIHTHNHESAMSAAQLVTGPGQGHHLRSTRRLEHLERTLFPRVDQVWGVRQEDLDSYRAWGVRPDRLALAPNVVPDASFQADPQPGSPGRAAFFGSLWYPPNRQALEWLLDVWPAIRREVPGATLSVAGRGAPADLAERASQADGVELLGFVPDLPALLRPQALVVIPLIQGGGTKIKTIEALAAGKPLLVSPVGAEGLALEDGVQGVVREPGADFLQALAAMLRDPGAWQAMALRGQAHVRARFSMAGLQAAVDRALDGLIR